MRMGGYVISLILAFMVMASMVLFSGASAALFINIPAMMVVVVFPLVLLRASFSFAEMGRYFRMALRDPGSRDPGLQGSGGSQGSGFQNSVGSTGAAALDTVTAAELKRAVLCFNVLRSYLLSAGFIGGIIGTITILANLSDTAHVGFGAALVLLTILYALILSALVVLPLRTSLEKQLAGKQTQEAG